MQTDRPSSTLRLGLLLIFGLILTWLVTSRTMVSFLAVASPSIARVINASDSRALIARVEKEFAARDAIVKPGNATATQPTGPAASKAPATVPEPPSSLVRASDADLKSWLETALARDPLNTRALSLLARLAADTNEARATALMQLTVARSRHESQAIQWLLARAYEAKDDPAIVANADLLLRTRPVAREALVPYLTAVAERESGRPELIKLLAEKPVWRKDFFRYLPNSITNSNTPLRLFLDLKETANPPISQEIRPYLDFLLQRKFHELAYFTWLQFLTPEQMSEAGFLYNGSFESEPSGMPFDWDIASGSNVMVEIRPRPDSPEKRALFIEFAQGRVQFQPIGQTVLLAPGRYTLRGQYRGDINGRRGLVWRATCAGGDGERFGESAMIVGSAPSWREFQFSFEVPDRAVPSKPSEGNPCRAQRLRLEHATRSASEDLLTGGVWFDELIVRRD
jgi:hypothetical protein